MNKLQIILINALKKTFWSKDLIEEMVTLDVIFFFCTGQLCGTKTKLPGTQVRRSGLARQLTPDLEQVTMPAFTVSAEVFSY